jgi:segregation and condensation protein B
LDPLFPEGDGQRSAHEAAHEAAHDAAHEAAHEAAVSPRPRRAGVAEHRVPAVLPSTVSEPEAAADVDLDEPDLLDDPDAALADPISEEEALAEILRGARAGAIEPESETSTAAQTLPLSRLRSVLESLLFVADKPLTTQRFIEILEEQAHEPSAHKGPPLYQPSQVNDALQSLADSYLRDERGIELHQVAGGWQLRTAASNAAWVQRQLQQKPQRLSRAQLETLTIVAYRQPITRPEIDDVRGVDSGGSLKTLLERRLVRILGKKEEPGRPLLYGTTREFLEFFNLRDLKDLPTLREYYELNDENKARVRAAHPDAGLVLSDSLGGDGQPAGPQQISLPDTDGPVLSPGMPPLPGLMPEPLAPQPAAPPPISRVEILDQQLADDAEQLAKIDELIASAKGETPPMDVLLGMAEAAARADSDDAHDPNDAEGDEPDDSDLTADAARRRADSDDAEPASPSSASRLSAESAPADPAAPTARRGRKKAQES